MPAGQRLSEELKFDQGKVSQLGRKHIRKLDASRCRWVLSDPSRGIDGIRLLDGAYGAAIDGKCQSIWLPVDLRNVRIEKNKKLWDRPVPYKNDSWRTCL